MFTDPFNENNIHRNHDLKVFSKRSADEDTKQPLLEKLKKLMTPEDIIKYKKLVEEFAEMYKKYRTLLFERLP
jgi:hypothetical protein